MSISSNALLRHKVIDKCLRDKTRKYTLIDLINACTNAIKQKYGTKIAAKYKVSVRSLQLDLQIMRDKHKGYGAPIVVYNQKYYKYSDPDYTIDNARLGKATLSEVMELVSDLKDFASFKELSSLRNLTGLLSDGIATIINKQSNVVENEPKQNPLGLEYFNAIYDAIVNKKALCIGYWSSRSNNIMSIIFYPFYLKEYKGRWYALGYKDGLSGVYKLPLDRIRDYSYSILPFPDEYTFNPQEYFHDIIGVTRLSGEVKEIKFMVQNRLAPFIRLNPLHHSQKLVYLHENGDMEFAISIIPNREFYNLIFEYQPYIQILSPRDAGVAANERVEEIVAQLPDYSIVKQKDAAPKDGLEDDGFNLFSNL